MKVLALDTSGPEEGVCIFENGEVRAELQKNSVSSHTVSLLASIQSVLDQSETSLQDIELFAVTLGPGSFTGIRIGMATVKALCRAGSKPVVGVSTLLAMAAPHFPKAPTVISCLDARLGEIYVAAYRGLGANQGYEVLESPQLIRGEDLSQWVSRIPGEKYILGRGLSWVPGMAPMDSESASIRSSVVASLALELFHRGEFGPGEKLRPIYLRVSEAQRRRQEREKLELLNTSLSKAHPE